MNKRILCLDVGDVRIGVAVSDPTRTIATPVEVIRRVGWGPDARRVKALCDQYDTDEVLSGLPLNMDGTEQEMTGRARNFGLKISKQFGVKLALEDERLTSASAKEEIFAQGGFKALSSDKGRIDSLAAVTILEQYFSEHV